jgi:hypothetical protein
MARNAPLPAVLRVEVKFTTRKSISVVPRERSALKPRQADEVGVVAAMFWCGDRDRDGRWLMVDANEAFPSQRGTTSMGIRKMARIAERQASLAPLRSHVDVHWPRFLRAFMPQALESHEVLKAALADAHSGNGLAEPLSGDDPLEFEHRERIAAILKKHGASLSGLIFQDFLAYLLGMAGYRDVQLDPVGVPDIEVSGLTA